MNDAVETSPRRARVAAEVVPRRVAAARVAPARRLRAERNGAHPLVAADPNPHEPESPQRDGEDPLRATALSPGRRTARGRRDLVDGDRRGERRDGDRARFAVCGEVERRSIGETRRAPTLRGGARRGRRGRGPAASRAARHARRLPEARAPPVRSRQRPGGSRALRDERAAARFRASSSRSVLARGVRRADDALVDAQGAGEPPGGARSSAPG